MTGLRQHERDRRLPAQVGQSALAPPDDETFIELLREHLATRDAPAVVEARLEYARWKPGVSTTCAWHVRFEGDEAEHLVGAKLYASGKDKQLAGHFDVDEDEIETPGYLKPRGHAPEHAMLLWSFPFDRVLKGLRDFMSPHRLVTLVRESGFGADRTIKSKQFKRVLLRYKPERRAVWRLKVKFRKDYGPRESLAVRIVPPAAAVPLIDARQRFAAIAPPDLTPRWVGGDAQRGVLIEEWVRVKSREPDDFRHAGEAARLLAQLHALPSAPPAPPRTPPPSFAELFAVDPELVTLARYSAPKDFDSDRAGDAASTWCHGDFHPDQVVRRKEADGSMLMDLDLVGGGDPQRDLSEWIADHLYEQPGTAPELASDELFKGYREARGPAALDERRVWNHVVGALRARSAASIRRLERGGIERARHGLELARALGGASHPGNPAR